MATTHLCAPNCTERTRKFEGIVGELQAALSRKQGRGGRALDHIVHNSATRVTHSRASKKRDLPQFSLQRHIRILARASLWRRLEARLVRVWTFVLANPQQTILFGSVTMSFELTSLHTTTTTSANEASASVRKGGRHTRVPACSGRRDRREDLAARRTKGHYHCIDVWYGSGW